MESMLAIETVMSPAGINVTTIDVVTSPRITRVIFGTESVYNF